MDTIPWLQCHAKSRNLDFESLVRRKPASPREINQHMHAKDPIKIKALRERTSGDRKHYPPSGTNQNLIQVHLSPARIGVDTKSGDPFIQYL